MLLASKFGKSPCTKASVSTSELRFDGTKSEPSFSFQPAMRLMSCANLPVRQELRGSVRDEWRRGQKG